MCDLEKTNFGRQVSENEPATEKLESVGCAVVDGDWPEQSEGD